MKRILLFLIILCTNELAAQIRIEGAPSSNNHETSYRIPIVEIPAPSADKIENATEIPNIASIILDANFNFFDHAKLVVKKNGDKIYLLSIKSKNASAINVYYDKFQLPIGSKLFIYNPEKDQVHGAFSAKNNSSSKIFTHDYITKDQVIIEYNEPAEVTGAEISINQIGYFLRDVTETAASADCEVNVNCSEGDDWQDEKKGVVRILVKVGNQTFWCSGSLVNNTDTDCSPYILSAEHCTNGSNQTDNDASIIYFNYEANTCAGTTGVTTNSMTGFNIISSGPSSGSDFILMQLKTDIPDNYNPYFNGWKKNDAIFSSGVSIHHPSSDIKKISTYNSALQTTTPSGGMTNGYWGVTWSSTTNGHGITEGGSSGSPIFNNQGLIVGTLTGGNSFCSTPTKTDYYAKFSMHWDQNGSTANKRLVDWLDPSGTGISELKGTYKPCTNSISELTFDQVKIWPNPSANILNIELQHKEHFTPTILLFDLRGKILYQKQLNTNNHFSHQLPTGNFATGNYILSITTPSISQHQSIVIAR